MGQQVCKYGQEESDFDGLPMLTKFDEEFLTQLEVELGFDRIDFKMFRNVSSSFFLDREE